MKDEELEDCSPIFKDFVNINLLKENADEMAPKPVRNDISAPPLNNYSTSNSYFNSENQGEEFNKSQTRNPDDNSKLISKSKLEDKLNNNENFGINSTPKGDKEYIDKNNYYYVNKNNTPSGDSKVNENKDKDKEYIKNNNESNTKNNNDSGDNGVMDYFLKFGKNYFKSFLTSSQQIIQEKFNEINQFKYKYYSKINKYLILL